MQEKDTEAVNGQRVQRSRVSRMKNAIIWILSGWVVLSMLLIVCLFVLLFQTRSQVADLISQNEAAEDVESERTESEEAGTVQSTQNDAGTDVMEGSEDAALLYFERDGYVPAVPAASGISEEENLAAETDVHRVYLTFEDGPSENTVEILNILKEKGVQATFFVTGQEGEAAQAIYRRIVEEGHTLGMHSYSNKYSELYQSEDNFKEDVVKLREYLLEVTGVEPVYYRFPGGSSNQITNVPMENLIHYLNQEGLVYYDWNVSSGDAAANAYTMDEIVANVTGDVVKYKTSVVLMHDAEDTTIGAEALGKLIDELLVMGVEILPIDENTSVIQSVKAAEIK